MSYPKLIESILPGDWIKSVQFKEGVKRNGVDKMVIFLVDGGTITISAPNDRELVMVTE